MIAFIKYKQENYYSYH